MRICALLLLAVSLCACVSVGERQAHRYYVLEARPAAQGHPAAVEVAPTMTAAFYDTQDIVFSREPGVRAYYQFNHWTERPNRAIHAQLVARIGSASGSPYILVTRVDEIYHDAAVAPGLARITLAAELVDRARHATVVRHTFMASAPARSYDAGGAVQGCSDALDHILADLAAWLDAETKAPR